HFGLYPGLLVSPQRDLTEPLAYALVACAICLFDFGGGRRFVWAGLVFAVAALGRETTVIFPVAYALSVLPNWHRAVKGAGLALLPLVAYELFLWRWLGIIGTESGPGPIPFMVSS